MPLVCTYKIYWFVKQFHACLTASISKNAVHLYLNFEPGFYSRSFIVMQASD